MSTSRFLGISAFVLASGCAIAPYEQSFQCPLSSDFGSCVDVEGAYDDAVAGPASTALYAERPARRIASRSRRAHHALAMRTPGPRELVGDPATPALTPPTILRTWIRAYRDTDGTLFAPRFVFHLAGESTIAGDDALSPSPEPATATLPLPTAAR